MKNKISFLKLLLTLVVLSVYSVCYAQDWVKMMQDPNSNFRDVQKAFYSQNAEALKELREEQLKMRTAQIPYRKCDALAKIPGYKIFKRWEWFMEPRVGANGEFDPAAVWKERQQYNQNPASKAIGNWTFLGPANASNLSGAGRLNFVRLDPANSSTIYVGSPSGGLWKSTDNGVTWATNTDDLNQVIGCTDLAIDPNNTNTMYLATGDGDAGDNYSIGVLKSTDGGQTWNSTGLSFSPGNVRMMSKILLDPSNPNNLIVATSGGMWRSTDAGATFAMVQAGSFKDAEFKPGDANTVYACGSEFYKSTDNGATWTKITSGLPAVANVSRMAIAVTPADPNMVYMIVGLPAPNYGTEGFYKSSNSGTSFTKSGTPSGLGNQQWYDLCIAVSPTNAQEIVIGGQTGFIRSTNGGSSFSSAIGTMHVDFHDIIFVDATTYYVANDGGVYRTTNNGNSYSRLHNTIQISQMYGFGQSASNANLYIQGWQDNGTNLFDGSWGQTMGGDGMLCFISHGNDNNMWGSQYDGSLNRSTNGGNTWNFITGISETGAWVTPWLEDPVTPNTIWAGFINMFKSTNGGVTWTKKSTFTNTGTMNAIAVSKADNNVVWCAKAGALYVTNNGGTNWTNITNVPGGNITGIACSDTDPNKAWITYSGYSNKNKVFQTNDQGATWVNLSASIPNVPVNCVTYVNGSNDAVYIGTDIGVFYKDASLNVWQNFSSGLPTVIVTQINIFYPTGAVRVSTYGRGLWESSPYAAGTYAPIAYFSADKTISCAGAAINYSDLSSGQPTSWNWTFAGGNPSTSTNQNPTVYYNTPGVYEAKLVAVNANGSDSLTFTSYITISNSPYNAPSTSGAIVCGPAVANLSATGTGLGTLRWWDAPGGGNMVATGNNYAPNINGTKTFYVDEEFPSGNQDFTGEGSNGIGAGAYFTANDIRGLYFDVINPVILNTVDVYSGEAANRTIEILDSKGNTYIDTTVFIPASSSQFTPVTVTLNLPIYPGNGYFIKCRGLVNLFRNSAGAVYPYVGNSVNVTGSNAGLPGYYYFFYNWVLTEIVCNTARTACTALDTCSSASINEAGLNAFNLFPNPTEGIFTVSFEAKPDDYKIEIMNAEGRKVAVQQFVSVSGLFRKEFDLSHFAKGAYTVTVTNSVGETRRKLLVY